MLQEKKQSKAKKQQPTAEFSSSFERNKRMGHLPTTHHLQSYSFTQHYGSPETHQQTNQSKPRHQTHKRKKKAFRTYPPNATCVSRPRTNSPRLSHERACVMTVWPRHDAPNPTTWTPVCPPLPHSPPLPTHPFIHPRRQGTFQALSLRDRRRRLLLSVRLLQVALRRAHADTASHEDEGAAPAQPAPTHGVGGRGGRLYQPAPRVSLALE